MCLAIGGKFARSFSIAGKKKPVAMDEDVAQLVEACRRYQVRGLIHRWHACVMR